MDVNAEIGSGTEIDAMLVEAGRTIFSERTIFNIQIFDHLLESSDERLDESIAILAEDRLESRGFIASYFANGAEIGRLVAALAPRWPGILTFLHTDGSVSDSQRRQLLDGALGAISDEIVYDTNPALGVFIQNDWRSFASLTDAGLVNSVDALVRVLEQAEVRFDVLSEVSPDLIPGSVARSLYELTSANVTSALGGEENLALNNIRGLNADVFGYVVANLTTYVEIQNSSLATEFTIDDHDDFVATLNALPNSSADDLWAIVAGSVRLRITGLMTLNERYWPLIARAKLLVPSMSNVSTYIEKLGSVDDDLAALLNEAHEVSDLEGADEAQQRALALLLVNSPAILAHQRIKLASTLEYSQPLRVSEILFDSSDPVFVGRLVSAGLIEDEANSFEQLGDLPWPSKRAYILASSIFTSYIDEVTFRPVDLQALAQDAQITDSVKGVLLDRFETLLPSLTKQAMAALGQFALSSGTSAGGSKLLAMANAGVNTDLVVRLASSESPALTVDELLAILRAMPEQYRKLTSLNGQTKLPNTPADLWLADRLVELEQVSSRDRQPTGNEFRVNLRRST